MNNESHQFPPKTTQPSTCDTRSPERSRVPIFFPILEVGTSFFPNARVLKCRPPTKLLQNRILCVFFFFSFIILSPSLCCALAQASSSLSSLQCNIIAFPPLTRPPHSPAYLWAAAVVGRRFVHNFIGLHFHHLGAAAEAAAAIAAAVVDVYVDSAAGS